MDLSAALLRMPRRGRLCAILAPDRVAALSTDSRALVTALLTGLLALHHGSGAARLLHLFLCPGLEFGLEADLVGKLLLLLRQL